MRQADTDTAADASTNTTSADTTTDTAANASSSYTCAQVRVQA